MSTDSNSNLLSSFRNEIEKAKHLVIMTGAGVSAESGIPTFRGEGGLWRSFNAQVSCCSNKKRLIFLTSKQPNKGIGNASSFSKKSISSLAVLSISEKHSYGEKA